MPKRPAKRKPLKESTLPTQEKAEALTPPNGQNASNPTIPPPVRKYPNGQPCAQPLADEIAARREQVKRFRFVMGLNEREIAKHFGVSQKTISNDLQAIQKERKTRPTDEQRDQLEQQILERYEELNMRHFRVIPQVDAKDDPKTYSLLLRDAGGAVERHEKCLRAMGVLKTTPLQVQAVGGIQISPTPEALEYCRLLMEKRKQSLDVKEPAEKLDGPSAADIRR